MGYDIEFANEDWIKVRQGGVAFTLGPWSYCSGSIFLGGKILLNGTMIEGHWKTQWLDNGTIEVTDPEGQQLTLRGKHAL